MQETEKIWMNGELVDWADAKIHVGSHGLHYGSGVFEGIRCYDTPKGPAVFRLTDHLSGSRTRRRCCTWISRTRSRSSRAQRTSWSRANGLASCYLRPIAFYGYGELGVSSVGNPVESVIISLPWGAYLGEDSQTHGITTKISSWERVGPERDPACRQGDRDLSQLDARHDGGAARRLRRGDHALARRLHRRRPGREHLRREGRRHPHAAARHVDPARDHARLGHPDRAGSRLPRRGDAAHPHRPLSRRRGVHGGHGRRGDAGAGGRRPRDRRRAGHAGAPAGIPRHRATAAASAGATGSTSVEMSPAAA